MSIPRKKVIYKRKAGRKARPKCCEPKAHGTDVYEAKLLLRRLRNLSHLWEISDYARRVALPFSRSNFYEFVSPVFCDGIELRIENRNKSVVERHLVGIQNEILSHVPEWSFRHITIS